jgi:hypothetical protein
MAAGVLEKALATAGIRAELATIRFKRLEAIFFAGQVFGRFETRQQQKEEKSYVRGRLKT